MRIERDPSYFFPRNTGLRPYDFRAPERINWRTVFSTSVFAFVVVMLLGVGLLK